MYMYVCMYVYAYIHVCVDIFPLYVHVKSWPFPIQARLANCPLGAGKSRPFSGWCRTSPVSASRCSRRRRRKRSPLPGKPAWPTPRPGCVCAPHCRLGSPPYIAQGFF